VRERERERQTEMHIGYWWEIQREGNPLRMPRCRWLDNIKMGLVEIGWYGVYWIDLAQNRDK
jgi:hypothetical protein